MRGTQTVSHLQPNPNTPDNLSIDLSTRISIIDELSSSLAPFLEQALGTSAPVLLESGFMCTAPGAQAQLFHRDVAPSVVSCSSMTVSIQVKASY